MSGEIVGLVAHQNILIRLPRNKTINNPPESLTSVFTNHNQQILHSIPLIYQSRYSQLSLDI